MSLIYLKEILWKSQICIYTHTYIYSCIRVNSSSNNILRFSFTHCNVCLCVFTHLWPVHIHYIHVWCKGQRTTLGTIFLGHVWSFFWAKVSYWPLTSRVGQWSASSWNLLALPPQHWDSKCSLLHLAFFIFFILCVCVLETELKLPHLQGKHFNKFFSSHVYVYSF